MGMKRKMMEVEEEAQDAFVRFEVDNPNPYAGTMFAEVWQDAFSAARLEYDTHLDMRDTTSCFQWNELSQ